MQYTCLNGGPIASIVLLLGFVQNQGDGWSYVVEAMGRCFERVSEAHPDLADPEAVAEMTGPMQSERLRQLGQHLGELHLALAADSEDPRFAPEFFTTLYQRSLYQAVRGQLRRTVRLLGQLRRELPETLHDSVETVVRNESVLLERLAGLLRTRISGAKIVVHGAFHLGQVLNTGKDFVITDLEGDPSKSLSERGLKRSPLRDVASMLRSFDYASHSALGRQPPPDQTLLAPWAAIWTKYASDLFLAGYREATPGAVFLPGCDEDFQLLLDVFLLDRTVAEIANGLAYRPETIAAPLRALCDLIGRTQTG